MMSRPWNVCETSASQYAGSVSRKIFDGGVRADQPAQQAVVRGDVLLPADAGVDDRPLGAHARIDHGHVDRVGGKPVAGVFQHQGRRGGCPGPGRRG